MSLYNIPVVVYLLVPGFLNSELSTCKKSRSLAIPTININYYGTLQVGVHNYTTISTTDIQLLGVCEEEMAGISSSLYIQRCILRSSTD